MILQSLQLSLAIVVAALTFIASAAPSQITVPLSPEQAAKDAKLMADHTAAYGANVAQTMKNVNDMYRSAAEVQRFTATKELTALLPAYRVRGAYLDYWDAKNYEMAVKRILEYKRLYKFAHNYDAEVAGEANFHSENIKKNFWDYETKGQYHEDNDLVERTELAMNRQLSQMQGAKKGIKERFLDPKEELKNQELALKEGGKANAEELSTKQLEAIRDLGGKEASEEYLEEIETHQDLLKDMFFNEYMLRRADPEDRARYVDGGRDAVAKDYERFEKKIWPQDLERHSAGAIGHEKPLADDYHEDIGLHNGHYGKLDEGTIKAAQDTEATTVRAQAESEFRRENIGTKLKPLLEEKEKLWVSAPELHSATAWMLEDRKKYFIPSKEEWEAKRLKVSEDNENKWNEFWGKKRGEAKEKAAAEHATFEKPGKVLEEVESTEINKAPKSIGHSLKFWQHDWFKKLFGNIFKTR